MQRYVTYTFSGIKYRNIPTKYTCNFFINSVDRTSLIIPNDACYSLLSLLTHNFGMGEPRTALITKIDTYKRKPYNYRIEIESIKNDNSTSLSYELDRWCDRYFKWKGLSCILYSGCHRMTDNTTKNEFDKICFDETYHNHDIIGMHYIATNKLNEFQNGIIMYGSKSQEVLSERISNCQLQGV